MAAEKQGYHAEDTDPTLAEPYVPATDGDTSSLVAAAELLRERARLENMTAAALTQAETVTAPQPEIVDFRSKYPGWKKRIQECKQALEKVNERELTLGEITLEKSLPMDYCTSSVGLRVEIIDEILRNDGWIDLAVIMKKLEERKEKSRRVISREDFPTSPSLDYETMREKLENICRGFFISNG